MNTIKVNITKVFNSDGSLDEKRILSEQVIPQVRAALVSLAADNEGVAEAIKAVFTENAPKSVMPTSFVQSETVRKLGGTVENFGTVLALVKEYFHETCITGRGKGAGCRLGTQEELAAQRLLRAAKAAAKEAAE